MRGGMGNVEKHKVFGVQGFKLKVSGLAKTRPREYAALTRCSKRLQKCMIGIVLLFNLQTAFQIPTVVFCVIQGVLKHLCAPWRERHGQQHAGSIP